MSMRITDPGVTLTVTDDHFARAVPGDACHCTIGEATHDALKDLIPALNLQDVDASTIQVHPASIDGEPVVSVGFVATDKTDTEVTVQFLLADTAAFKVAYVTDNRATAGMRRAARNKPYSLKASEFKIRKRDARVRADSLTSTSVVPQRHIVTLAANFAHRSSTPEETAERLTANLEKRAKAKELPYKLTPSLKKFAAQQAVTSFGNKGTKPRPKSTIKVYSNKRFYTG